MAAKNRRTLELRLGKLGLILFVGGISILLFSMFLLGVLVGKQMEAYPERYSAGMAELIYDRLFAHAPQGRKAKPPAESGAKGDPAGEEEGFGLTFYDTLSGKKGAPKGKIAAAVKEKPPEAAATPPLSDSAVKPPIPDPSVASGGGVNGNRVLPSSGTEGGDGKKATPQPEKMVATEPGARGSAAMPTGTAAESGSAPETGRFEIQVAAYQESGKAEQMIGKLHPLGFSPRVVMKDLPDKGRWFRVVIGGFDNREKAKAAADRISEKIRGVKCVVRPSS